jgi:diguanylate cyclase (GGDEF)-like protein
MLDLDHYKEINDTFGHSAGDHVLTFFAELVLNCTRKTDLVARYGGDEFIIVLPATNTETAEAVSERIRQTLLCTPIPPYDEIKFPFITCSLGISTYPAHGSSKDDLVKTADAALYKAKNSGRNLSITFSSQMNICAGKIIV